ncbi:MAG TPA: SPASM domain-containing protein, partial [Planctomycetota bacterium]|nr:SPASM domain-containing protein [Planctomycetota bacterium]
AGLDFFERIVAAQQQFGKTGQVVGNALQTNATLIDERWAKFLAKYRWLVGVSLDGPREVHNVYRRKAGGGETFHLVLRGLRTMQQAGVAVNALCLVSQANVRRGPQVYKFLRDQKFDFLQFIPCIETDPDTGKLADYAITGSEFGDFLCDVFDVWKVASVGKVSVRYFDAVRRFLIDGGCDLCVMGKSCDAYLLVEFNGDVYPCDFFMYDEWRLGNLMETPLAEIGETPLRRKFAAMKAAKLARCENCEWLAFCHGGCPKDRLGVGDPLVHATELCAAYRRFLPHAVPFFREIDAHLRSQGQITRDSP